jgi:hypothetical protein
MGPDVIVTPCHYGKPQSPTRKFIDADALATTMRTAN